MPHFTFRTAAAAFAFLLGLTLVWLSGLLAPAEAEVAEWLVPTSDINVPACTLVGPEEDDAQRVYATVLREVFGGDEADGLLIIRSETVARPFTEGDAKYFDGPADETLRDYLARNRVSQRLPHLPGLGARQVLLDADEYASMFGPRGADGWTVFYERFPNSSGYLSLSAVGFSHGHDEAFVHARRSFGEKRGEGGFFVLRKTTRGWEIERTDDLSL